MRTRSFFEEQPRRNVAEDARGRVHAAAV